MRWEGGGEAERTGKAITVTLNLYTEYWRALVFPIFEDMLRTYKNLDTRMCAGLTNAWRVLRGLTNDIIAF